MHGVLLFISDAISGLSDCMWGGAQFRIMNDELATAAQDDEENATRLRKNAISCSVAQLGREGDSALQSLPRVCRRNAHAKHVKDCMWVWLRHSFEFRSLCSLEF